MTSDVLRSAGGGEGFPTVLAFIGLYAGVNPNVLREV